MLDADRLASLLETSHYGRSLDLRSSTVSTNDDAQQAARQGAAVGHVVMADHQQAGRGSHGRVWSSPPGSDIYLSIVDRPNLNLLQLPPLTLAVGLGVADTVAESLPHARQAVQVKWPNDVWVREKKCAGILVEASSVGDQLQALVIGIGLNVNRLEFPGDLEHPATSLRREYGAALDRESVAARLLGHVERWVTRFVHEGAQSVSAALAERLVWRGAQVECGGVVGRLLGVASHGALELMTPTGLVHVVSGRLRKLNDDK